MNNLFFSMFPSLRIVSQLRSCTRARFLFSSAGIGVDDYAKVREKYDHKTEVFDKFKNKMKEYCDSVDPSTLIFTEDLKQFIHMTTGSDEELSLILKMMEKFYHQNEQLRFGSYNFGPVVMRMYHHLNKPDEALQAYNNPKLDGFFDQLSTQVIILDLLFINKRYEDIIAIYDTLREKQLFFGRFPKNVLILVFASCHKINTAEMFDYSVKLWKEMCDSGLLPVRRAACFVASLALKHNSPHVALEILSGVSNQNFVLIRSLKIYSFCALRRLDDVFPILTSVLTFDAPSIPKQTFPSDVIECVKDAVEKSNDKEALFEFSRIEKQLHSQGHISPTTLDEMLFSDIIIVKPVNQNKSALRAAFNGVDGAITYKEKSAMFRRPGLAEMS